MFANFIDILTKPKPHDFQGIGEVAGFRSARTHAQGGREESFTPAGYMQWLNRSRPEEAPKLTKRPLTPKGIAEEFREMFREMMG